MLALIYLLGVVIGSWGLVYKHKHLLVMLLMIEFCVVNLFGLMFFMFSLMEMDMFFMMVFLTLGVCEGGLGLGILVLMFCMFGNDYFFLVSLLEC
uniref:NADH-ubiquinone oxidoreductase chain 4L n=1 Tax=Campodea lubbockii TaxID=383858 RepID=Q0ZCZ6_9HEXA|nr:NADH dehydrogenase subunit 4L [Campodea lubbockii]ABF49584.1 NADH dehydrogenase subunit 4L [Campodea lubbockii]